MNKKSSVAGVVCFLGILAIISSQTLELSDFLSGFILGLAIVAELVAVYVMASEIKKTKKDK